MLNIIYQNCRGLRTKTEIFHNNVLLNDDCFIFGISESWLIDSILDPELAPTEFYNVFRRDRTNNITINSINTQSDSRRGGGVMIITHNNLNAYPREDLVCNAECIWVTIPPSNYTSKRTIHVSCLYLPQGQGYENALSSFLCLLANVKDQNPDDIILVIGDFNMPTITWKQQDKNSHLTPDNLNSITSLLADTIHYSELNQYNSIKNANKRILDLVICNEECLVSQAYNPLVKEDLHHPSLKIILQLDTLPTINAPPKEIYRYDKADYDLINQHLSKTDWSFTHDNADVDEAIYTFYDILNNTINQFVPKRFIKKKKFPNWYSPLLIKIIKEKQILHKKWKSNNNTVDYIEFSIKRIQQKHLQKHCYTQYINSVESSIPSNKKSLWNYAKNKNRTSGIPQIMNLKDESGTGAHQVCQLFCKHFQSTYVSDEDTDDPSNIDNSTCVNNDNPIGNVQINESLVNKYLNKLDVTKSAGSDGISPYFISKSAKNLAYPLTNLFNMSLKKGIFPTKFKEAIIIPIHKTGSKSNIANYRPISILTVFSKLFERIVYDQIYITIARSIQNQQHGFLQKRSVLTNLVNFTEYLTSNMDNRHQVDVIYTDYSKAFDKVNHSILIKKLHQLGIHGDLLRWLTSYLQKRLQCVSVEGNKSSFFTVPSGVPQGSHLGPLLFNVYIFDIYKCFLHANYLAYADDKKIYLVIKSINDCIKLQEDLNRLFAYCKLNKLILNISKCNKLSFTRNKNKISFNYNFHDTHINELESIRDLGVVLDIKLNFINHINEVINKANKMLGFIIRISKPFRNIKTMYSLYTTYIRPHLEYCTLIWAPFYQCHIDRIESVQNKFFKHINYKFKLIFANNTESLKFHNFIPLQTRRLISDQIFLYKILNNGLDSPELVNYLRIHVPTRPTRLTHLFHLPVCRTNLRKNSPIPRICAQYNTQFNNIDILNNTLVKYRNEVKRTTTNVN